MYRYSHLNQKWSLARCHCARYNTKVKDQDRIGEGWAIKDCIEYNGFKISEVTILYFYFPKSFILSILKQCFFWHFLQIEKRPFTEKVHSGHVWDGCMSLHFQDLDETVKANHFPGIQELGNKKKLFKVSFAFEGSRLTCCLLFSSELLLHAQETWARRLEIHGGYIHAAIRG